jgi:lipopolysaccharide/colanic/teichoic acid biosynthesis glycosyltransferase
LVPKWQKLPREMVENNFVKEYFEVINSKKITLYTKRLFDIVISFALLELLLWLIIIVSLAIVIDSPGGVFFKQRRVTQYGKIFCIIKFRTMLCDSEKYGSLTQKNDHRITRVGKFLRKLKIDEIPQLVNVLFGQMTFVGTRPEVPKYVEKYSPEMMATLLLPAGITSTASIKFRNEENYLKSGNYDRIYISEILPKKMKYNLEYLKKISFFSDLKIILATFLKVISLR